MPATQKQEPVLQTITPGFPVVAVGASAGGLEALTAILAALPSDIAMAFVLIQHLDPKRHSMMPELLSKATRIPVLEARDAMKVEPNHVYVMPSNVDMSLTVATLRWCRRGARHVIGGIDHAGGLMDGPGRCQPQRDAVFFGILPGVYQLAPDLGRRGMEIGARRAQISFGAAEGCLHGAVLVHRLETLRNSCCGRDRWWHRAWRARRRRRPKQSPFRTRYWS